MYNGNAKEEKVMENWMGVESLHFLGPSIIENWRCTVQGKRVLPDGENMMVRKWNNNGKFFIKGLCIQWQC